MNSTAVERTAFFRSSALLSIPRNLVDLGRAVALATTHICPLGVVQYSGTTETAEPVEERKLSLFDDHVRDRCEHVHWLVTR